LASACLVLALLAGIGSAVADDPDRTTQRLGEVKQEIERVQAAREAARGRLGQMEGELRETEADIGRLRLRLERLDDDIAAQQRRLRELETARAGHHESLAAQREALAAQARAAYIAGDGERLRLLLNQGDPAAVSRLLAYHDYFQRVRLTRIDRVSASLEALAVTEAGIRDTARTLENDRETRREELSTLETRREERRQLVAAIETELRAADQTLSSLQEDENRLQTLLESLRRALIETPSSPPRQAAKNAGKPFASLKGRLPWPAEGPVAQRFGSPREGSIGLVWRGVLIGAAEGREVRNVHAGRVVFAGWMRGYGLLTIVDHGNGYMTLYGHNQSLHRNVGDWVDGGAVIARVGDSGGRAQAGLYFEIRHQGKPLNPAQWCSSKKTTARTR
jgi:septal ring factor EnvC (AmiA/AmiB activator)